MRNLPVGRMENGGTLLIHSCQLASAAPMLNDITFYGWTLQLLTCTAATASNSKNMYLGAIFIFV